MTEYRVDVTIIGVADIRALGVEDYGNIRGVLKNVLRGLSKRRKTLITVRFIECAVRLVCAHEVFGRVDNRAIECNEGLTIAPLLRAFRYLLQFRVETDAQEFSLVPLPFQKFPKIAA